MRSRALSRGDHGCCAAAVRPPFSAASQQRCSSHGAMVRSRARRWPLRCAVRCGRQRSTGSSSCSGCPASGCGARTASWPVAPLAEAIRPSLLCCLCGLSVRCQLYAVLSALAARRQCGPSTSATAPAAPLRARFCSPCLLAFQTGGWVGLKLAGTRLSGDRRRHVHELRIKASPLVACLLVAK